MKKDSKDKYLKEPNKIVRKLGEELTFVISLRYSEKYPKTSVAMESVAKAEERDDNFKRKGNNDYSISLQELFNAFDTFIREFTNGENTAGRKENYNLSNSCDFTILLLWQIRHTWIHKCGLIDEKCKKDYESIMNSGKIRVNPIIPLPKNLKVGYEFEVKFEDYLSIKNCILSYIKKRVPKEDFEILRKRSSISSIGVKSAKASIVLESGILEFNLADAYDCGCKDFSLPPDAVYDPILKRVILPSFGKSFPAKFLKIE